MRPRDDGYALNVNEIWTVDQQQKNFSGPLRLVIPEHLSTRANIEQLGNILSKHPGQTEVLIFLKSTSETKEYRLKQKVFVDANLISEIKQHFGTGVLDLVEPDNSVETSARNDVSSLMVEQAGELFGQ